MSTKAIINAILIGGPLNRLKIAIHASTVELRVPEVMPLTELRQDYLEPPTYRVHRYIRHLPDTRTSHRGRVRYFHRAGA